MLSTFRILSDYFKIKLDKPCIDNAVFKLHYRATTLFLLASTILVTATQYFGTSISCYTEKDALQKIITNFCFFSATFTLVDTNKEYNENEHWIAQLGPITKNKNEKKHLYYQWVPFMLFGQAIMFYLTHLMWKNCEKGRIQLVKKYLNNVPFVVCDKQIDVCGTDVCSMEEKNKRMSQIRSAFMEHVILSRSWSKWLTFFEILNFCNSIFQFYLVDLLFEQQFYKLGWNIVKLGYKYVDTVFPKMTKCEFHTFGASGTIQNHDALCLLSLNIINEKVYVFLWFWFVCLIFASGLAVVWRFLTIALYSRSSLLNKIAFGNFKFINRRNNVKDWDLKLIRKYFYFNDWIFLKYMSKNMDSLVFKELLLQICDDIVEKKPFFKDTSISTKIGFMFDNEKQNK